MTLDELKVLVGTRKLEAEKEIAERYQEAGGFVGDWDEDYSDTVDRLTLEGYADAYNEIVNLLDNVSAL
jgi:hypothetical protein